jgi:hypothetical protein
LIPGSTVVTPGCRHGGGDRRPRCSSFCPARPAVIFRRCPAPEAHRHWAAPARIPRHRTSHQVEERRVCSRKTFPMAFRQSSPARWP